MLKCVCSRSAAVCFVEHWCTEKKKKKKKKARKSAAPETLESLSLKNSWIYFKEACIFISKFCHTYRKIFNADFQPKQWQKKKNGHSLRYIISTPVQVSSHNYIPVCKTVVHIQSRWQSCTSWVSRHTMFVHERKTLKNLVHDIPYHWLRYQLVSATQPTIYTACTMYQELHKLTYFVEKYCIFSMSSVVLMLKRHSEMVALNNCLSVCRLCHKALLGWQVNHSCMM